MRGALLAFTLILQLACTATPVPPSFVIFLADDQGWSGTSVAMDERVPESKSDYYETPHLDSLAAEGMRFSNAYRASANCSPSRISLLTGKSPAQLGMTDVIGIPAAAGDAYPLRQPDVIQELPETERTLAELASLAEGGTRVPLVIRGPGVAAGSSCHTPVIGWDLLPTVLELAGFHGALPPGVEGGSLVPVLRDPVRGGVLRPREELVWHFPHYRRRIVPHSALRLGDYKLVATHDGRSLRLYDLSNDLGEGRDLSGERPEKTALLRDRLYAYLDAIGARRAEPRQ